MKSYVILNPYASRWKAGKRREETEQALKEAGVDYEIVVTDARGHATELARAAIANGYDRIVAAGGDGTISEVVNGIMLAGLDDDKTPQLGIMPLGTANDLVINLEMPVDLTDAAKIISNGRSEKIDVCKVNDRYFVNNAGLGLESYISVMQNNMVSVHGIVRYLLATFKGISHNPQWEMKMEWDGGEYEGSATLVSIGNGELTGGIFFTTPGAKPDSGKLAVTFGHIPTRLRLLRAFPMILRSGEGNITEHPAVQAIECTRLKITTSPTTPAHADGEIFETEITSLEYQIFPGRLPVLMG
ncbi:MAG: diacylglycerol kinase family lipid kinase [Anaerolineae bacterium]|nr:diacylglycerol kinase family lipid kinase [Anaerolineae bacterium]